MEEIRKDEQSAEEQHLHQYGFHLHDRHRFPETSVGAYVEGQGREPGVV
jgi:hypothetical protein